MRDVRDGVLLIGVDEISKLVDQAIYQLEVNLPGHLEPLSDDELEQYPDSPGAIFDWVISNAVEKRLRMMKPRMAHVMYAIAIRGRRDRKGRRGWADAADVLQWLGREENYPRLKVEQIPALRPMAEVRWYPPSAAAHPAEVIKRSYGALVNPASGPVRQPFDYARFLASIKKALLGRPEAEATSKCVAEWVLWTVGGQREVHTMQLAVYTCDCLRRVDDVAYLRWVSLFKGITQVSQFREEALALLVSPSPRLIFDPTAAQIIAPDVTPRV